jgi:hypothetical protein
MARKVSPPRWGYAAYAPGATGMKLLLGGRPVRVVASADRDRGLLWSRCEGRPVLGYGL